MRRVFQFEGDFIAIQKDDAARHIKHAESFAVFFKEEIARVFCDIGISRKHMEFVKARAFSIAACVHMAHKHFQLARLKNMLPENSGYQAAGENRAI